MARAARVVAAALLVAAATVATTPTPASAAEPLMALASQPPWVNLGEVVQIHLTLPPETLPAEPDLELRVRVHRAVQTSAAFDTIVDGGRPGDTISSTRYDVATLPREPDGSALVVFGLTGSPWPTTLAVSRQGVYPLEFTLEGDEVLESFVTWLVVVDPDLAPQTPKLRVAPVWRVVTPPIRDVDGAADPDLAAELGPGGRVDMIATLLEATAGQPLSLQVGPETLEAWDVLASSNAAYAPGLQRVEQAITNPATQVLPAPYVPIDFTSLEAAGLGDELPDQLVLGSDVIEGLTEVTPDPRTAVTEPVDAPALARLRDLLVDRVIVRDTAVVDGADAVHAPFSIDVGSGLMRAAAADTSLMELLRGSDTDALRAQRVLAGLSVAALENKSGAPAGVVLLAPDRWTPDLEANRLLYSGMAANPLLQPATLDTLFADVPAETRDDAPVVHALEPHEPAAFPVTGAAYTSAQVRLSSLRATLGPTDPDVQRGERALVLALSTDNTPAEAAADLHVIEEAVSETTAGVTTTHKRVTLTAREADVPLSFQNTSGKPVTIRVRLSSAKLEFPDGSDRVVTLPEGNSTESFRIEARASGTFPMTVFITSPDGRLAFGPPTRITVRSAVFSGVGAALTVGALLFLLLWWANHFRRARRARRLAAAP
jgi:hypothetical protein